MVEDLQETLDGLNAAGARSTGGRDTRIGKIVDLDNAVREGMAQLRILDGILSIVLKPTPGLLAEWRDAKRVFRRRPADQPVETPGGNAGWKRQRSTPPVGS